jgi:D-proline reductase (dithiol) PrdB
VGLIQRAIEAAGISTISISLSKEITRKVNPPRAVFPGHTLGRPLGAPGRASHQLKLLRHLLKYLEEIETPGTMIELNLADNEPIIFEGSPKPSR